MYVFKFKFFFMDDWVGSKNIQTVGVWKLTLVPRALAVKPWGGRAVAYTRQPYLPAPVDVGKGRDPTASSSRPLAVLWLRTEVGCRPARSRWWQHRLHHLLGYRHWTPSATYFWSLRVHHLCPIQSSSSRMCVIYHNWSATMKQRPHPQSVAEISHHLVLSGDRIRQCETSSGSRHKDTDQCL